MRDYERTVKKLTEYARKHEKQSRFEHSLRVAEMCVILCRRYGLDEQKGYLAGIGHDICKDIPKEKMIKLAQKDGEPITEFEQGAPSVLHGRAAAVKMKKKFGIDDEEILEAVANHVSCKQGICDIGKVLFLADKIEPNRPQSTEEYRANLMKLSLDGMLHQVLVENYEYIKRKGYVVYPGTEKMIEYYGEKK